MIHYRLNDNQRKIIEDNYPILKKSIKDSIKKNKIPYYLLDDFISDAHLKFCMLSLRYDKLKIRSFPSYVYKSVDFCVKEVFRKRKQKYQELTYFPELELESLAEKLVNKNSELDIENLCRVIEECRLKKRDKKILFSYYLEEKTLLSLAKQYNMTKEGVRQIVISTLNKIKVCMKSEGIEETDFLVRRE